MRQEEIINEDGTKTLKIYSTYSDSQKKATQKYIENNREKVNEQRKKYYQNRKNKDPNFLTYKREMARLYYQQKKKMKEDKENVITKLIDIVENDFKQVGEELSEELKKEKKDDIIVDKITKEEFIKIKELNDDEIKEVVEAVMKNKKPTKRDILDNKITKEEFIKLKELNKEFIKIKELNDDEITEVDITVMKNKKPTKRTKKNV